MLNRLCSLEEYYLKQEAYICLCKIDRSFYSDIFNLYGICRSTEEIKRNLHYIFEKRDYISDSSRKLMILYSIRWWRRGGTNWVKSVRSLQTNTPTIYNDRSRYESNGLLLCYFSCLVWALHAFRVWKMSLLSMSMDSTSSNSSFR